METTMSIKKLLATAAVAIPMAFASIAAQASSVTFQGVTFSFTAVDSNTVTLEITNAVSGGTGNWTDIAYLWTLGLNPSGTFTSATIIPDATFSGNELNDSGCTGGLSGKACFTYNPPLQLTDDMLFTLDFLNYTGDFTLNDIFGVKVGFLCTADGQPGTITSLDANGNYSACGSLMSLDTVSSSSSSSSGPDTSTSSSSSGPDTSSGNVPESGSTLTLLGLGLLGLGFTRRMKKTA
jgi:VPDSG-CTERM motif